MCCKLEQHPTRSIPSTLVYLTLLGKTTWRPRQYVLLLLYWRKVGEHVAMSYVSHKDVDNAATGDLLYRGMMTSSQAWKWLRSSETLCEGQRSSLALASPAGSGPGAPRATPQYGRKVPLPQLLTFYVSYIFNLR
jgi:hypothetical protein